MIINDAVINFVIIFIFLELYEVSWQKASTLIGMLARMYEYYSKNIWLFLIMQPAFYFSIAFAMLSDYNPYALMLVFIKAADVATKIILIEQVFVKKELSEDLSMALLAPLNGFLPYMGALFYPILIVLALQ